MIKCVFSATGCGGLLHCVREIGCPDLSGSFQSEHPLVQLLQYLRLVFSRQE